MSPIRPENRDRYPPDWPTISRAIKERAGWRCECTGECGRGSDHLGPDPIEREDLHATRCMNHHGLPAYTQPSDGARALAHQITGNREGAP